MFFKILYRENIPCWYELSFSKEKRSIVLSLHKDFVKKAKPISQEDSLVVKLKQEFGFKKFVGCFDGNFGFDDSFIRAGVEGEFIKFFIQMPKDDEEWKLSYTISASFSVFSSKFNYPVEETSSPLPQLFIIGGRTKRGMYGCPIGGEFSPALCNWLSSFEPGTEFLDIVEITKSVYAEMYGDMMNIDVEKDQFQKQLFAKILRENGHLIIGCPGDRCGTGPVEMDVEKGKGYRLESYNVDQPMQQLTLLVGLCVLHDKAREGIKRSLC